MSWEAEPNSALGWAPCRTDACEGRALVVKAWAEKARCGVCLAAHLTHHVDNGITPVIASVDVDPDPPVVVPEVLHPTPGHTSRQPLPEGYVLPDSVLKLAEFAREAGWTHVDVTYSRGHGLHSTTGRPTSERHVIAVHVSGHLLSERSAVAVYESPTLRTGWSWSSIWVWGPDLMFFRLPLLTELNYFLLGGGQVPENWITDIRARVLKAEADKKAIEARDRKIRAGFAEGRTVRGLGLEYRLPDDVVEKIVQKKTRTVKEGNS